MHWACVWLCKRSREHDQARVPGAFVCRGRFSPVGTPSLSIALLPASGSFQPGSSDPPLFCLGRNGLDAASAQAAKIPQEAFSRRLETTSTSGRNVGFGATGMHTRWLGSLRSCEPLDISRCFTLVIGKVGLIIMPIAELCYFGMSARARGPRSYPEARVGGAS